MCGIVGYLGNQEAWPIILEGLQRLEYRGYDSAGIAISDSSGGRVAGRRVGGRFVFAANCVLSIPVGHNTEASASCFSSSVAVG